MKKIQFSKMHGLGNDFVVVDARTAYHDINWSEESPKILHRRFGIGADTLLVLQPSTKGLCFMRIFERDGAESENCGNGLRCVGKYLRDFNSAPVEMKIETLAGVKTVFEASRDKYRVQMGKPGFGAHEIFSTREPAPWGTQIDILDKTFTIYTVSMGNPHAVIYVDTLDDLSFVKKYGPAIENHPWFIKRTNVNFVYRAGPYHMIVRTWERSAGHTLACGTGACAVGVVSIRLGLAQSLCVVRFEHGDLEIEWQENSDVWMSGPSQFVFQGEYKC